mmetsp:Transcript_25925/g.39236  ORF Transcript_25925/g.39236 Transcript_25925/m.39236 type:complete len:104 (+) Transcript_25925:1533-1844(+)
MDFNDAEDFCPPFSNEGERRIVRQPTTAIIRNAAIKPLTLTCGGRIGFFCCMVVYVVAIATNENVLGKVIIFLAVPLVFRLLNLVAGYWSADHVHCFHNNRLV